MRAAANVRSGAGIIGGKPIAPSQALQPLFAKLHQSPIQPQNVIHLAMTHALVRSLGLLSCCIGLSACAHRPAPPLLPPTPEPAAQTAPVREYNAFAPETFYSLLVAEVAGNRNRLDVMLSNYQQQAQSTRDPEVVARACRLARFVNQREEALNSAPCGWKSAPGGRSPPGALAELLQANRLQEAFALAEFLVSQGEESGFDALAARAAQQSVAGTPQLVNDLLPLYQNLTARYPD